MCREHLVVIYRAYLARTCLRIDSIERWLSFPVEAAAPLTEDEGRNAPDMYSVLFSEQCRASVEKLYIEAMSEIKGMPYDRSEDVLNGLAFIQELIATALWKHHCAVGPTLESFAREFDRLDLQAERERLHARAQVS